MEDLRYLPSSVTQAYEALGNAVNTKVVGLVAEALLNENSTEAEIRLVSRSNIHFEKAA